VKKARRRKERIEKGEPDRHHDLIHTMNLMNLMKRRRKRGGEVAIVTLAAGFCLLAESSEGGH